MTKKTIVNLQDMFDTDVNNRTFLRQTDEVRNKISKSLTGRDRGAEFSAKVSKWQTGRKLSEETRAKISAAMKGKNTKPQSKEHRKKLSEVRKGLMKGRIITPEHRAKISAAMKGRVMSPEHRAKISATKKSRKTS